MAEVMAIMNASPLVPLSYDTETATFRTPAMLLTRKVKPKSAPHGDFDLSALLYKQKWKHVQCLADTFWKCWSRQSLPTVSFRTHSSSRKTLKDMNFSIKGNSENVIPSGGCAGTILCCHNNTVLLQLYLCLGTMLYC